MVRACPTDSPRQWLYIYKKREDVFLWPSGLSARTSQTVCVTTSSLGPDRQDLIWPVIFSTRLNRPHISLALSLSRSQARGKGPLKGRAFGVVPGWSERIPGLSTSSSTMSHRYFIESPSHVLGFHQWNELGFESLI
jgi:hypothetical protein